MNNLENLLKVIFFKPKRFYTKEYLYKIIKKTNKRFSEKDIDLLFSSIPFDIKKIGVSTLYSTFFNNIDKSNQFIIQLIRYELVKLNPSSRSSLEIKMFCATLSIEYRIEYDKIKEILNKNINKEWSVKKTLSNRGNFKLIHN